MVEVRGPFHSNDVIGFSPPQKRCNCICTKLYAIGNSLIKLIGSGKESMRS